ncbi:uncharacterized protein LOC114257814 [Camellia sinensis]|uniref:uncharacterized protein LOC114257814 n=1 Tax=Camellia sinensis TaxID=4442 RepID=UPI0010355F3C|nr:uncharacterized protein LOC114257814 [Camellia sinensis]
MVRPTLNGPFKSIGEGHDSGFLEAEFSEEEILSAIKSCGGNKALGPDGFNMSFFQKCWHIVKEDVFLFMRDFHQNAKLVRGLNSSFIALIPKNENPASLNEYRPINLVGSMYKILAKILSNRLKQVLPRIISETQSAFMRGRNILDGILIANEIVDGWNKARGCGIVLKLDFHKAYDSVNWEFLFSILFNFGFGPKWMSWMKECVASIRTSVLVNRSPTPKFCPQRGLRQGDPLSPFLFIIVAETLNILLGRAKNLGLIKGASVGPSGLQITHLQFADDTILFCEADWAKIVNIKRILRCFEVLSGLRIKFKKSVVYGVGIPDKLGKDLAIRLNCKYQKLPIKYLGLPLGASPSSSRTWLPVIDKCKQKLASWKRRYLSFTGRLTLIKSVLASLPIFYFSIFKMLEIVAKNMESIQSAFLWDDSDLRRKVHLWWWRFGAEENSLWKDVICGKYREPGWAWFPSTERASRLSKIWGDIIRTVASRANLMQFFRSNTVVKIGDGRRIRFWSDCWSEGVCLRDEFPRLYSLSVDKVGYVFMFHSNRDAYGNWVFNFRRPLFAWEEEELSRLLVHLSSTPLLKANVANCLTWNTDTSGCFSVSSAYQWFELGFGSTSLISRSLWKAPSPPRAQFFGWLVWRGRIKSASCGGLRVGAAMGFTRFSSEYSSVMRNDCVFNEVEPNFIALCETVEIRIALWVKSFVPNLNYSVHDLVHNLQQLNRLSAHQVLVFGSTSFISISSAAIDRCFEGLLYCTSLDTAVLVCSGCMLVCWSAACRGTLLLEWKTLLFGDDVEGNAYTMIDPPGADVSQV